MYAWSESDACAQLAREGDGVRVIARQLQVVGGVARHRQHAALQHRALRVAHRLVDRRPREELLVVGEEGDVAAYAGDVVLARRARQRRGVLEREQPELAVRLERHRVVDDRSFAASEVSRLHAVRRAPFAAVEAREHRPAPVTVAGIRWLPTEGDAKRHRIRARELADRTGRHAVRKTGARPGVCGRSPERTGEAWKQEEQQRRERNALQQSGDRAQRAGCRSGPGRRRGARSAASAPPSANSDGSAMSAAKIVCA